MHRCFSAIKLISDFYGVQKELRVESINYYARMIFDNVFANYIGVVRLMLYQYTYAFGEVSSYAVAMEFFKLLKLEYPKKVTYLADGNNECL